MFLFEKKKTAEIDAPKALHLVRMDKTKRRKRGVLRLETLQVCLQVCQTCHQRQQATGFCASPSSSRCLWTIFGTIYTNFQDFWKKSEKVFATSKHLFQPSWAAKGSQHPAFQLSGDFAIKQPGAAHSSPGAFWKP